MVGNTDRFFASTIGATCAFLVARYLLKETVQRRFGERLQALNHGVEKERSLLFIYPTTGAYFPFFLINILMGLTTLRAVTFYQVSQLGMLAGTLVYVNAGTQLAQLESLGGILSPAIFSLVRVVRIFPLVAKKVVEKINQRRRVSE
ncbi:TVP38/TMEM64 family protein [Vibrio metschnikovii]